MCACVCAHNNYCHFIILFSLCVFLMNRSPTKRAALLRRCVAAVAVGIDVLPAHLRSVRIECKCECACECECVRELSEL